MFIPITQIENLSQFKKDIFNGNPFEIIDGCVEVTTDPGWGVEINLEWLENSDYQATEIN